LETIAQQQTSQAGSAGAGAPAASARSASTSKVTWYVGFAVPTCVLAWGLYDDSSPPAKVAKAIGLTGQILSFSDKFARPAREKLIPDWADMPQVPHDIPIPPTLVLDLENTLVSSTWDRKHGWRHAKRPGVDKFLMDLSQYYEIILYSPSVDGVADPVVDSLDKHGCIMHRLYRDATYYKGGVHVKDLSKLNRNLGRMIAIDDDAKALQLNPQNLIKVKPYDDPSDREDDDLLQRLTPFLIEIAREGYSDFPSILSGFATRVTADDGEELQGLDLSGAAATDAAGAPMRRMDAGEMVQEYEDRIARAKQRRAERASRGLGALATVGSKHLPEPDLPPPQDDMPTSPTPQPLTAKNIVGSAPTTDDTSQSGGGVMGWFNRRQKEQEEQQMRKMEKWNEVMMKKQLAKKEAAKTAAP